LNIKLLFLRGLCNTVLFKEVLLYLLWSMGQCNMGILFEFDFDPKQFPSAVIAYFVLNRFIPVRNANLFVSTHACVCAGEQNSYL